MARASRAVWAKRVEQWATSRQLGHTTKAAAPTFVEVVAPMVQPQNALEVKVGELQVVVPVGFDERHCGGWCASLRSADVLPDSVRILVCTARQDMRRSFDTLAAVVRDE